MRYPRFIRSKKAATDLGIIVGVGLFFVAGVFFEAQRSAGRLPEITRDAGAISAPVPTASTGSDNVDDAVLAEEATAVAVSTSTPAPERTPDPVPIGTPNPGAVGQQVFLELRGIENESVVDASTVTITGVTTPDALLSVNGQAIAVELDGSFSVDVQLEQGPNFVEFVSSNLRGQETSRVISVVSIQ